MALLVDVGPVTLRRWQESDHAALVEEANSRAVWRSLTRVFPHPYTTDAAEQWIAQCLRHDPARNLAVDCDGRLVGEGVSAYTGSVGYWLGERHWGQGIASLALGAFLEYVWYTFAVRRLEAEVFAWNPASARVLEKHGFVLEGTRVRGIHKDGEFVDEWFYALFRPEVGSP